MAKQYIEQIYHSPTDSDAYELANELLKNIREVDLEDITLEVSSFTAIKDSIRLTDDLRVFRSVDNKLLCIAGVTKPNVNVVGRQVWMLGTPDVYQYKRELLVSRAKQLMITWLDKYVLLLNCVNVANYASVRWLQWLGAIMLPDITHQSGKMYYNFFFMKGGKPNV